MAGQSLIRILAFLALCLLCACSQNPQYDLVIRNGRLVDGTGHSARPGDIAVFDGRIAAMGTFKGRGRTEIDASGLVVAPGFIDVHTHVDDDILRFPLAENFVRDGVTTIVCGNCGGSVKDIRGFFDKLSRKGAAVNVATFVGHNTILRAVKGDRAGELTPEQMDQARQLVSQAMLDGALGMSTGLIYSPGQWSSTAEIIELQRAAARHGGIYATHMRSETSAILAAIDEAIAIGREARCRVQISHFKLPADAARAIGGSNVTLQRVLDARRAGIDVGLDQYPYTASSTTISTLLPDSLLEGGAASARGRLADPAEYQRAIGLMREFHEIQRKRTHFNYAVVSFSEGFPQYAGRSIYQIAQMRKLASLQPSAELLNLPADQLPAVSMEDQYRAILDIYLKGDASCVFHSMNETDVENIMRCPLVSIASDSGIRQLGVGMPHPRGYGTNARVLGRYVRERKVLSLEEAVRRMTLLPASQMGFKDRGLLHVGQHADITVFDPATVQDKATFDKPHRYAEGITHVIVNGRVVLEGGRLTGALPGVALYGPGRR